MPNRILTLHPEGKEGVNIDKAKYTMIKQSIEANLRKQPMTFKELGERLKEDLAGKFEGSIMWYYTTTKLDLEARGIIKKSGKSPQMLSLAKQ